MALVTHPPLEIQQPSEESPAAGQHQVQAGPGGSRGGRCAAYCDHHTGLELDSWAAWAAGQGRQHGGCCGAVLLVNVISILVQNCML